MKSPDIARWLLLLLAACIGFGQLSSLGATEATGTSERLLQGQAPSERFEASGRFGLRLEQGDRKLHLQGLFEVKTDHQKALVELFDPAGQRLVLWRQPVQGEAEIETAHQGPNSASLARSWLARQGVLLDLEHLDAWRWRRWLELEPGRFRQGSLLIERSDKSLLIEQNEGTKLRLLIVPTRSTTP